MSPNKKRGVVVAVLGLPLLLFLWLFVGVYRDREFYVLHLFIKHRPTTKIYFYSPRGEAGPSEIPGKEGYLTPEKQKEEDAFVEFVETGSPPSPRSQAR